MQELLNILGESISLKSMTKSIHSDSREQRYSGGVICLHCRSTSVIKHGKKNGVQRFRCKDCHKTFNNLTLTPMANSKVCLEQWMDYAKCMIIDLSIRKSAEISKVSVKTSSI